MMLLLKVNVSTPKTNPDLFISVLRAEMKNKTNDQYVFVIQVIVQLSFVQYKSQLSLHPSLFQPT